MTVIPQIDPFEKTANYWLKRAFKYLGQGQARHAAVLFRHAARLEPASLEARMGYAIVLRALHCYEASNREAAAALAYDSSRYLPYYIMGLNMHATGHKQEALDAIGFYLEGSFDGLFDMPAWDKDLYENEEIPFDPFDKLPKKQARLERMLQMAAKQIKKGALSKAKAALFVAYSAPYAAPNAQRSLLTALYYEKLGDSARAIAHTRVAAKLAPNDCEVQATAAGAFYRLDEKHAAMVSLLRAASLARYALHELMVCTLCEQTGQLSVAATMLISMLKRTPNRQTTCYNLCVCYLKAGKLSEASGYIHLCREIDTDDMQVEYLFTLVEKFEMAALSPDALREKAQSLTFYGMLTRSQLKVILRPLIAALDGGVEGFAKSLMDDQRFANRFLSVLPLPACNLETLLPSLCRYLPADFAQTMLRNILLLDPKDAAYKQVAIDLLAAMHAPAPYIIWHEDHIISVEPGPTLRAQARLLQRLVLRQIRLTVRLHKSSSIIPFVLEMISRMTRAQRLSLAHDPLHIWPVAFCLHYSTLYHQGEMPVNYAVDSNSETGKLIIEALSTLSAMRPRRKQHEPD
ncbi:MAG: hypothetical protein GX096_15200 [Clostridiales bacterium]|nr:hypothetical protein [Clostridiales bacterium]